MAAKRFGLMLLFGVPANIIVLVAFARAPLAPGAAAAAIFAVNTLSAAAVSQYVAFLREIGLARIAPAAAAVTVAAMVLGSAVKSSYVFSGGDVYASIRSLTLPHAPVEIASIYLLSYSLGAGQRRLALLGAAGLAVAALIETYISPTLVAEPQAPVIPTN